MYDAKREYFQLTYPQKRIWYMDTINSNSQLNNIGGSLNIKQDIDISVMKQTINEVIKLNDGLRLRFKEKENNVLQYVEEFKKNDIDFFDFSDNEEPENEFKKWRKRVFYKRFDIYNEKLYYFAIYKLRKNEFGILLKIHHIISDGWTIALIEKQVCKIYEQLMNKDECIEGEFCSYIDYIEYEKEYLNSEHFKKNKAFWNKKFQDIPEEFLYNSSDNLEGKRSCFEIDENLSKRIFDFIKDKRCSLNSFFIAILALYTHKNTGKENLVIGTPVYNRNNKAQKNMVGMFTSTLPFRINIDKSWCIDELIKHINRQIRECFLNQKYPYDLLIKDLKLSEKGYDSLFKVSVNYYNSKYDDTINGEKVYIDEYYCGSQSYSLQIIVKEMDEEHIELNFDYKTKEYTEDKIQKMYKYLINIINSILENSYLKVNEVDILNEKEKNYKIYDFNTTEVNYPQKCVYELLEDQVKREPNKVAIEFKEEKLTYKEFNNKVNQLAYYLKEVEEIASKSIIAVSATHSLELMISIFAILKTGASYLPIDPSYPKERILYMLEDSKACTLLTNIKIDKDIEDKVKVIDVKKIDLSNFKEINLGILNDKNDLSYIIYTSGSTGKPKGVMVTHGGLTNYICWANKEYLKDEDDVMPLYSSISFDLTVTSIFTPLISGHKIIIYDKDDDEFVLYKILRENKVTVVKLTPAHLTLLKDMDNKYSNIKRFIVGGEDLKVNLAKQIDESFGGNIKIFNEYGPTETVVGCMTYIYDRNKDNGLSVPIGYPADNVQIYLLDKDLNVVPDGVDGEIYISGDGVAKGYLNRKELTLERFVENPFIDRRVMYKTGDLARYLDTGAIEYVNRVDNQVKVRGHRIELGEIEGTLIKNESIKNAVTLVKDDSLGNKILVAYVVSDKELEERALKKWLMKFVPNYMIPSMFVFVDDIPLTVNGKVNYSLLHEIKIAEKRFVDYKTTKEKELVEVMQEVLGVKMISMNDNFYQLGGDSIKAIQISSKLKDRSYKLKVKDIISNETIDEIADAMEISEEVVKINQDISYGTIKNTPIVKWFFDSNFQVENRYNQYILIECDEDSDENKVNAAVNELIKYHDSLRVNYDRDNNCLYYNNSYLDEIDAFKFIKIDENSDLDEDTKLKLLMEKADIDFNIENTLLFNVVMFEFLDKKKALLFVAHHLIVDGVSWRIILNDFNTIINQLKEEKDIKLPLKSNSLKEWAEAMYTYSEQDFHEEILYWNYCMSKYSKISADFDNGKDSVKTAQVIRKSLSKSFLKELIKVSEEVYSLKLNEILILALVLTISKTAEKKDVVIEIEEHGRENINKDIDVSRTVGWFTSIYPAVFKVDNDDLNSNLKSLKEQFRNIPSKGFNYSILKYLKNKIEIKNDKLVRFNFLGDINDMLDKSLKISKISMGLDSDLENKLTYLIDVLAFLVNGKLVIEISYSENRFKKETINNLIDNYINELNSILEEGKDKKIKEFTPSDFNVDYLSQEDLDNLFD